MMAFSLKTADYNAQNQIEEHSHFMLNACLDSCEIQLQLMNISATLWSPYQTFRSNWEPGPTLIPSPFGIRELTQDDRVVHHTAIGHMRRNRAHKELVFDWVQLQIKKTGFRCSYSSPLKTGLNHQKIRTFGQLLK